MTFAFVACSVEALQKFVETPKETVGARNFQRTKSKIKDETTILSDLGESPLITLTCCRAGSHYAQGGQLRGRRPDTQRSVREAAPPQRPLRDDAGGSRGGSGDQVCPNPMATQSVNASVANCAHISAPGNCGTWPIAWCARGFLSKKNPSKRVRA